jgi:hypothetical protein
LFADLDGVSCTSVGFCATVGDSGTFPYYGGYVPPLYILTSDNFGAAWVLSMELEGAGSPAGD